MRLSAKWFLWYLAIAAYALMLGGVFYRNVLRWTFDERLKQAAVDCVKPHVATLTKGLSRRPGSITMEEFDVLTGSLAREEILASVVYLNRYGDVRWFKEADMIGMNFSDFAKVVPFPTDAISRAISSKSPSVRPVPGQPYYEVAVPLAVRGEILGMLVMQVARRQAGAVIAQAMAKYFLGAIGVLILVGIPLHYFLLRFVLTPIRRLRDAVETVSFKNLDLKFPVRKDEIGDLAGVLNVFLQKVKAERANLMVRERERSEAEQRWWQSILETIVAKEHRAIVVDEDNTVLFTNFPTPDHADPNARLHLLDIIDSRAQDVLRLVGVALDRPNRMVETDAAFGDRPCHVRAVHLEEQGELRRTLILFEPKGSSVQLHGRERPAVPVAAAA